MRRAVVLNGDMKRTLLGLAALACVLGVAAPTASARIIELGASDVAVRPSCPDRCAVITRTTALPVNINGNRYPTTVRADGRVVAVTLQLGSLTERQIRFLNRQYGGTPRVQLTVLSQTARQKRKRFYTATAQSEVIRVTPFLGRTVQFPFRETLEVRRGDFVALTVPTWAPVLAVDLDRTNGWRASRPGRCGDFLTMTAQLIVGDEAQYKCLYQTARPTFSATMITMPKPPRATRRADARRNRSATRSRASKRGAARR